MHCEYRNRVWVFMLDELWTSPQSGLLFSQFLMSMSKKVKFLFYKYICVMVKKFVVCFEEIITSIYTYILKWCMYVLYIVYSVFCTTSLFECQITFGWPAALGKLFFINIWWNTKVTRLWRSLFYTTKVGLSCWPCLKILIGQFNNFVLPF